MKKVLFVSDRNGWAFHTKALKIKEILEKSKVSYEINICSSKGDDKRLKTLLKDSDLYVLMGFQNFKRLNKFFNIDSKKTIASIPSHTSFDNGKTTPTNIIHPPAKLITYLRSFKDISVVSTKLVDLFKGRLEVKYVPNGVDTNIFNVEKVKRKQLVVGYAGRDLELKGNKIIEKIVNFLGKDFLYKQAISDFKKVRKGEANHRSFLNYCDMPFFYKDVDIYVCFSLSEGSCRSILEAMSSKCIVISTDCGEIRTLVEPNQIINRKESELIRKLKYYKNMPLNDLEVLKEEHRKRVMKFDWEKISIFWKNWIEENL